MSIINNVKTALRISNTAFDSEIADLIEAAKSDLMLSGVNSTDETDPLIKRAITIYVKAHFGWNNPDAEKLQQSYDLLKSHLSLSREYAIEL